MVKTFVHWLRQLQEMVWASIAKWSAALQIAGSIAAIVVLVFLMVVDYFFHPQINFSLIYLLIVIFMTWLDGKRVGTFVAVITSLALFFDNAVRDAVVLGIACWNFVIQMGLSLLTVLIVSSVRKQAQNLEQNIATRTAALEREVLERGQTEEQLNKTVQQLRQLAENISDVFWMKDLEKNRIIYVSPAYEMVWGRRCKDLYQSMDSWLEAVHPEDRERVAQTIQTSEPTGKYQQNYRIVRPDGSSRLIRERVFPVQSGSGGLIRLVGIAEDVTEQDRLERQILEISDNEQARIGQDLHDSLCQKLISMAFDNQSLEQNLTASGAPEAETARRMAAILEDVITEARAVARGLFPVQLEANGLEMALQQLSADVGSRFNITCRLDCPRPVLVSNNVAAIHLYRIAQEAINNAIKHGKANSIVVKLKVVDGRIELRISDNGTGISIPVKSSNGMGLYTMDYRARAIGGSFRIERGATGGTVVSCSCGTDWGPIYDEKKGDSAKPTRSEKNSFGG